MLEITRKTQLIPSRVDQTPLSCQHSGKGNPCLLFIHGWSCRGDYWQPQLDYFSCRHEVVCLDLPGHGDTPVAREDWSVEAFGEDVTTIADALDVPLILIGHSMGGAVALEAARRIDRERLAGIVLVDTFLINYGQLSESDIDALYIPFVDNFEAAMTGLVDNCCVESTPGPLKTRLRTEMASADPAWAMPVWRSLLEWDPEQAFNSIKAPIHAINCPLLPESTRARLAPRMTDSVIPDTGHFLQMERPDVFNQTLKQVLDRFSDGEQHPHTRNT